MEHPFFERSMLTYTNSLEFNLDLKCYSNIINMLNGQQISTASFYCQMVPFMDFLFRYRH